MRITVETDEVAELIKTTSKIPHKSMIGSERHIGYLCALQDLTTYLADLFEEEDKMKPLVRKVLRDRKTGQQIKLKREPFNKKQFLKKLGWKNETH